MCYVYILVDKEGGRDRKREGGKEERERGKKEERERKSSNGCTMLPITTQCSVYVCVYGVLHVSPDYIMMCMHVFHMCVP